MHHQSWEVPHIRHQQASIWPLPARTACCVSVLAQKGTVTMALTGAQGCLCSQHWLTASKGASFSKYAVSQHLTRLICRWQTNRIKGSYI